jgi:hypothetical protein
LAQELAEAEAEAAETMLQLEGAGGGEMDQVRDLDDDVPDAEVTVLDDDSSDTGGEENDAQIEEVPRGVMASRIPDDVYREALVRGEEIRPRRGSTIDDEDQSQMLQEEDLVHESQPEHDMDMDIDADLDAEIPEAEEGGYEHTDSELELSTSDEESIDDGRLPHHHTASTSMVRSDGTQNSMDIGNIVSNASSQMGSSPQQRQNWRARRQGS